MDRQTGKSQRHQLIDRSSIYVWFLCARFALRYINKKSTLQVICSRGKTVAPDLRQVTLKSIRTRKPRTAQSKGPPQSSSGGDFHAMRKPAKQHVPQPVSNSLQNRSHVRVQLHACIQCMQTELPFSVGTGVTDDLDRKWEWLGASTFK